MNTANIPTCTLTKHHALGNDFLVLDRGQFVIKGLPGEQFNVGPKFNADWSTLARTWCDRRTGIGADGLLLLEIREPTRLVMTLYNADGGVAEMSGNGIRCLVQAALRKLSNDPTLDCVPQHFEVDTVVGMRVVDVVEGPPFGGGDSAGVPNQTMHFSVDMGIIEDVAAPTNWAELGCHEDRPVRHVSLGNPHAVVGVDNVDAVDLEALGVKVPMVNLEIVEPGPETNGVTMRVHERGAGLTMACGTGACAVADAARTWGLVPASAPEVIVHMPGGDVIVAIDSSTRRATLTGPATFVAEILIDLNIKS